MDNAIIHFSDDGLFLSHHGVKGMKWGRRKDRERKEAAPGVPKLTRSENRSLNKKSKKADKVKKKAGVARNRAEILKARENVKNHKNIKKQAKNRYKVEKHVIGSREAKKVLNRTKDRLQKEYLKSKEYASGKEKALGMALDIAIEINSAKQKSR